MEKATTRNKSQFVILRKATKGARTYCFRRTSITASACSPRTEDRRNGFRLWMPSLRSKRGRKIRVRNLL